jgi:hypothetical protein
MNKRRPLNGKQFNELIAADAKEGCTLATDVIILTTFIAVFLSTRNIKFSMDAERLDYVKEGTNVVKARQFHLPM